MEYRQSILMFTKEQMWVSRLDRAMYNCQRQASYCIVLPEPGSSSLQHCVLSSNVTMVLCAKPVGVQGNNAGKGASVKVGVGSKLFPVLQP